LPDGKYPGYREQSSSVTCRIDDQTELLYDAPVAENRLERKKLVVEIRDEHGLV